MRRSAVSHAAAHSCFWLQDATRALDQATQFGRVLRMEVTHNGAFLSRVLCSDTHQ
jgi:hypothetical protein